MYILARYSRSGQPAHRRNDFHIIFRTERTQDILKNLPEVSLG